MLFSPLTIAALQPRSDPVITLSQRRHGCRNPDEIPGQRAAVPVRSRVHASGAEREMLKVVLIEDHFTLRWAIPALCSCQEAEQCGYFEQNTTDAILSPLALVRPHFK